MFLYYFNVLMSKIIFKKYKKIILIYFKKKTLNYLQYHTPKQMIHLQLDQAKYYGVLQRCDLDNRLYKSTFLRKAKDLISFFRL